MPALTNDLTRSILRPKDPVAPDGSITRLEWLGDEAEVAGSNAVDRTEHLVEFRLELGLPSWRYELPGICIEKRVVMPYGQNTVHVTYQLVRGEGPIRMSLRPSIQFRGYEAPVNTSVVESYLLTATGNRYEVSGGEGGTRFRR